MLLLRLVVMAHLTEIPLLLMKRRLEASEGLLFGRKSEKMAKKLRNNSYLFGGSLNGGEGMSGSRRSSGN